LLLLLLFTRESGRRALSGLFFHRDRQYPSMAVTRRVPAIFDRSIHFTFLSIINLDI